MSSFSANAATSANAGVAQTAHNAQQLARQRDRLKAHESREADRLKQMFELRLLALEEGEQEQSALQVHIDRHMPQHDNRPPADKVELAGRTLDDPDDRQGAAAPSRPQDGPSAFSDDDEDPKLYRHLDIQA